MESPQKRVLCKGHEKDRVGTEEKPTSKKETNLKKVPEALGDRKKGKKDGRGKNGGKRGLKADAPIKKGQWKKKNGRKRDWDRGSAGTIKINCLNENFETRGGRVRS